MYISCLENDGCNWRKVAGGEVLCLSTGVVLSEFLLEYKLRLLASKAKLPRKRVTEWR